MTYNQYDALIKTACSEFLPDTDWRLLKAQLLAESNLDCNVTSPVGAMGIAQFMPKTWQQMKQELHLPDDASAYDHEMAIPAAAYYMAKLNSQWTAKREPADRYALALASYNAGFGNLINAQKKARGATEYAVIANHLHQITGHHAQETTTYVKRIFRIFNSLITVSGIRYES